MNTFISISGIFKDIITVLGSVATVLIAYKGLTAWRQQLIGKSNYELAKKLCISVYKVRNKVKYIRNGNYPAGEIYIALKEYGIHESAYIVNTKDIDIRKIDQNTIDRAIYSYRWKGMDEIMIDFDVIVLESEAVFSSYLIESIEAYRTVIRELYNNIGIRLAIQNVDDRVLKILHGTFDLEDAYNTKLEKAIKNIEQHVKPYLK